MSTGPRGVMSVGQGGVMSVGAGRFSDPHPQAVTAGAEATGTVAVVMTYNRRESVRQCLQAIREQTVAPASTIVVDNASTDGTTDMVAREFPGITIHRMTENTGCTGGMYQAIQMGLALDARYVWLLDDDAVPFPTCLETLLTEMRRLEPQQRVGILRPLVSDARTGEVMGGTMSHAALLSAEMAATVPFPTTALFMGFDDKIYRWLVQRAGFDVVRLSTVLAHHPVRRSKSLRQIAALGYQAKPWRLYYEVRNRVYFSIHVAPSPVRFAKNVGVALGQVLLLTMFGRPRRGQTLVLRGVWDGMRARLGRTVRPGY